MAISLSPEVLAKLIAQYGNGSTAGQPAEFYDEATNTAYQPQYGGFFTPDGQFVGGFAPSNGNSDGSVQPLSGFQAYNRIPGSNDNFDLNGKPAQVFDAQGNSLYETTMSGMKKNSAMDYLLPLAMVAGPFAAMVAPGLFGLGGAAAAGGAGTSIEALAAAEAAANAGGLGAAGGSGAGLFGGEGLLGGMGAGGEVAGGAGGSSLLSGSGLGTYGPSLTGGMGTTVLPGAGFNIPLTTGLADFAAPAAFGSGALGLEGAIEGLAQAAQAGLPGVPPGTSSAPGSTPPGTSEGSFMDKILSDPSKLLGPAATVAGALAGSQGQQNEQTAQTQLPDFLQQPVKDMIPQVQGLLASQTADANSAGKQMLSAGGNLLSQPIAGNGYGKVTLNAPTTNTNPYLSSMADDIGRRTSQMLGEGMAGIQSRFVGGGGYGNTRQGVAQGVAGGKAADYMSGQLAGLFGNAYSQDQNRALQQYGMDQSFFGQQRGQDLAGATTGAGLLSTGLDTQWSPLKQANSIYSSYSPYGNKTISSDTGGGWLGGVGGALGAAQLAKNFGWF